MNLRVITEDGSDPLSVEDLQARGNELLKEVRKAVLDALHESSDPIYFATSYKVFHVRSMQRRATAASKAWRKVDGLLVELLTEVDKTRSKRFRPDG